MRYISNQKEPVLELFRQTAIEILMIKENEIKKRFHKTHAIYMDKKAQKNKIFKNNYKNAYLRICTG